LCLDLSKAFSAIGYCFIFSEACLTQSIIKDERRKKRTEEEKKEKKKE
jgi:hypothetical protein